MERLRKSFRRKKQKEIAEDDAEEEIEKDEFEKKSVLNAEEPGDTEEEADEAKNGFGFSKPPISRLQKLRKSIRFSRKKKGKEEEENHSDFLPPDEPEIAPEEVDFKPETRMSRLRASLRVKKKKDKEKPEKEVVKKEKKEKKSSKWDSDDQKVRENHCEFKVKYLGSVEVQESRGMEVCESAIKILKTKSTNEKKKKLRAVLHVSGDGLRVVDKKTQGMLVDQVIEKVSFCAPDRNFSRGFAYISRDGTSRRWVCHGFMARRDTGERLSHAVGVAFAVCLERKQARECEGVSGNWDEDSGAFTRFGSFRQGTLTERLADPQGFKVTPLKVELGLSKEENPFAISRPRPGDTGGVRSSLRGVPVAMPQLQVIKGQSPFKRGTEHYASLRPQDLPSNIQRKEKSRVSLILEETFENEETKNEINAMMIMMAETAKSDPPLEPVEERLEDLEEQDSGIVITEASLPSASNKNQTNNNESGFKPPNDETSPNPWDLVPDQPKLKAGHSRTNSNTNAGPSGTNPADRWLASLTARISDLPTESVSIGDPLEDEWAALANRNTAKAAATNPFRACV